MLAYTYTFVVMRIFLWSCILLDMVLAFVLFRSILFAAAGKSLENSVSERIARPIELLEKLQVLSGYAYMALIVLTFYALVKLLTWNLTAKGIAVRFTPLLSGFSWLIPILNIFRRPQVIVYLRDNLPLSFEEARRAFLIPNWRFWALWWLILASRICTIFLSKADLSNSSLERWLDFAILQLVCDLLGIFWLFVLGRIIALFAQKLGREYSEGST